ncbi:hypothetical protein GCM10027273_11790 [Nocardioides pakistanensis]
MSSGAQVGRGGTLVGNSAAQVELHGWKTPGGLRRSEMGAGSMNGPAARSDYVCASCGWPCDAEGLSHLDPVRAGRSGCPGRPRPVRFSDVVRGIRRGQAAARERYGAIDLPETRPQPRLRQQGPRSPEPPSQATPPQI